MMKIPGLLLSLCCLFVNGSSGVDTDIVSVSVMEGDSVTLNTGVQTNQQDSIIWYYKGIRIARINGDQSKICTDVQCNEDTERFRGRLKLDHQTGSLTITNITNTDSGEYTLKITSGSNDREKIFNVSVTGADKDEVPVMKETDEVSVMEGDSVTLNTGVQTNQQEKITWYNEGIRIAQITRDQSKTCTDVQCNEGTERFRDRLKLDHQTGSLTIMNITSIDSGDFELRISNGRSDIEKIFSVSVHGVYAAERHEGKIKEGESVILDPDLKRKINSMTWYFNDIRIAEITGDQSQICTDDQCKERFRDRLKLDHQTGSLNITHTTHTHSGEYTLLINNSRFTITKTFHVTVTAAPGSGLSPVVIGGICAGAVILLAAAAVAGIYCLYRKDKDQTGNGTSDSNTPKGDSHDQIPLNSNPSPPVPDAATSPQTGPETEGDGHHQMSDDNNPSQDDTDVMTPLLESEDTEAGPATSSQTSPETEGDGLHQMSDENNPSQDATNVMTPLLESEVPPTGPATSSQTSPETEGGGLDQMSDENNPSPPVTNATTPLLHRENPQTDAASPQTGPETEENDVVETPL